MSEQSCSVAKWMCFWRLDLPSEWTEWPGAAQDATALRRLSQFAASAATSVDCQMTLEWRALHAELAYSNLKWRLSRECCRCSPCLRFLFKFNCSLEWKRKIIRIKLGCRDRYALIISCEDQLMQTGSHRFPDLFKANLLLCYSSRNISIRVL